MARLEVLCGPMFGGKSSELLARLRAALEAGRRCDIALPQLDVRSDGVIRTHDGVVSTVPVRVVPTALVGGMPTASSRAWYHTRDLQATDLFVDEVQFFDLEFTRFVQTLLEGGVNVTVAGLDLTSEGEAFGPVNALAGLTPEVVVTRMTALCECGCPATRSFHLAGKTGVVAVGDSEYTALCKTCWDRQMALRTWRERYRVPT